MIGRGLLPVLALAGCAGGVDTGVPPVVDATWVPVIASIDRVECTLEEPAGEVWQLGLTVTDPQGDETVVTGSVFVRNEAGGELGRYTIPCGAGACDGSFRADYDGLGCAVEGTVAFVFTVTDQNGNVSASEVLEPW